MHREPIIFKIHRNSEQGAFAELLNILGPNLFRILSLFLLREAESVFGLK